MFVFCYLHAVTSAVHDGLELGVNTRSKCRGYNDVDSGRKLLLLRDASRNVVRELTAIGAQASVSECSDFDSIWWQREGILVDPVHVHPNADVELLRICNLP